MEDNWKLFDKLSHIARDVNFQFEQKVCLGLLMFFWFDDRSDILTLQSLMLGWCLLMSILMDKGTKDTYKMQYSQQAN